MEANEKVTTHTNTSGPAQQIIPLELNDESAQETRGGNASLRSGVFNLANTILGAGMLGLPAAFAECGFVMGILLLFVFAFFSSMGLYLLSAAADIAGRPASLYAVAEKALPGEQVQTATPPPVKSNPIQS